ncbi:FAD-dependent oxidoreductase [Caenimonas aquaedulcis]|uniref:FAD-binding protein n=1 Tax=Caenimonas aquaedulcis TaxID=2793270 RepID=A0A931H7J8_9BURK|nr:FAD-dependent oxidoreductase [Caenimonas aquaedulcis]MBG9390145.1 FAD-binding protein [Caenimonas aquaedulcis]
MSGAAPCVVRSGKPQGAPWIPVAIVGGGACGLTATLMLADAGIECVVLERDAAPSGSTALSSGFIPAPGTRVQKARGIEDSAGQFERDIQAKAHGTAAPHLARAYARKIGPALDALEANHGLQWELLEGFLYPGHTALRMHAVPERSGAGLMSRLRRAADAAGVAVMTGALARELWIGDDGQVTGLGFLRPDGRMEQLGCGAVLLACNGFGGDRALVRELLPEMAEATFAGHAGNDGSAIAWGRALGARLADLGGYQGHGSWAVPQGVLVSWALMMEGAIQVNREGRRFHDETQGYSEAAVHVLAQPGGVAWNVLDDRLLAFAQEFPDFREAQSAGAVHRAPDTEALARLIGCSAGALRATLDSVRDGEVSTDGRRFTRALAPPYHAVKVTGALFHTQGGLDIDTQCRVLGRDGTPWPNLLAAGGAARGVSGNAVWGYLSGNGLLSAVAGGAIAARTATQWLTNKESP